MRRDVRRDHAWVVFFEVLEVLDGGVVVIPLCLQFQHALFPFVTGDACQRGATDSDFFSARGESVVHFWYHGDTFVLEWLVVALFLFDSVFVTVAFVLVNELTFDRRYRGL